MSYIAIPKLTKGNLMKLAIGLCLIVAALPLAGGELRPLHPGQSEFTGGLSITRFNSNLTKAGLNIDGGVTVNPYLTLIGEYNLTPLGSGSVRYFGTSASASARFHYIQGGGRLNIIPRGRVV